MVDHKLLTHGRLCQPDQNKNLFGNISVIALGNFYQLPPIVVAPLCKMKETIFMDLWNPVFSVASLQDIMRQKEEFAFANTLNRVRIHTKDKWLDENDLKMLTSRVFEVLPDYAPIAQDFVKKTSRQVNLKKEAHNILLLERWPTHIHRYSNRCKNNAYKESWFWKWISEWCICYHQMHGKKTGRDVKFDNHKCGKNQLQS